MFSIHADRYNLKIEKANGKVTAQVTLSDESSPYCYCLVNDPEGSRCPARLDFFFAIYHSWRDPIIMANLTGDETQCSAPLFWTAGS